LATTHDDYHVVATGNCRSQTRQYNLVLLLAIVGYSTTLVTNNSQIWEMPSTLVTGANGFVAAHVVKGLIDVSPLHVM